MGPGQEPVETLWEQHEEDTGDGVRAKSFPVTLDVPRSWLGCRTRVLLQVQGSTFPSSGKVTRSFPPRSQPCSCQAPRWVVPGPFPFTGKPWIIFFHPSIPHPTRHGSCCFSSWPMCTKTGMEEAAQRQFRLLTSQQTGEQLNSFCMKKEISWAGKDAKRKQKSTSALSPLSAAVCYCVQSFAVDFNALGTVTAHVPHRALPFIPGGAIPNGASQ